MEDWVEVEPATVELSIRAVSGGSEKPSTSNSTTAPDAGAFYQALAEHAFAISQNDSTPIFKVALGQESLYLDFLDNMPSDLRQDYTCRCCKNFTKNHGDLAVISPDGFLTPLLWSVDESKLEDTFRSGIKAIRTRFQYAKVTKEFKIHQKTSSLGSSEKGGFPHLYLNFPNTRIRSKEFAGFTSAATPELAAMLDRVLTDYDLDTISRAHSILENHQLPYADAHTAAARWLLDLVENNKMSKAKGDIIRRHNLLYLHAASAYLGCLKQLRSGALATLLDNCQAKLPWSEIEIQWMKMCDPLNYMRPQAAPSGGNIQAAERLMEQLGVTKNDFRRRMLVYADIPTEAFIWKSQQQLAADTKQDSAPEIFGGITPKQKNIPPASNPPPIEMSFTKFVSSILPRAQKVEYKLETRNTITMLVTGLGQSTPLMQWHNEQNRASHYVWSSNPPLVTKHGLKAMEWNDVRYLIPLPHLWDGAPTTTTFPLPDQYSDKGREKYKYYHSKVGMRYLFCLDNVKESNYSFLPLFPEYLKSQFHPVRSTIEAFCKQGKLEDPTEIVGTNHEYVGGVEVTKGERKVQHLFRVRDNKGFVRAYSIKTFE